MNDLRKLTVSVIVISMFLLAPMLVIAGEWSKEQKEVLSTVEAYSEMGMKRDAEGFLKYFHENYSGWGYEIPVPYGKESVKKWVNFSFPRTELLIYEIKPLQILVVGKSAVAHYYFYYRLKDHEGKEKSHTARWTDILVKDGGKWLLIADHGGEMD